MIQRSATMTGLAFACLVIKLSLVAGMLLLVSAACQPPSQPGIPQVQIVTRTLEPTSLPVTALPSTTPRPQPADTPTATAEASPGITHLPAGLSVEINSILMFSPLEGWGTGGETGADEHVLKTTDGGRTWQDATPPEPPSFDGEVRGAQVYFVSMDTGWVVYYSRFGMSANKPQVWRTTDGGASWQSSADLDMQDLEGQFIPGELQFYDRSTGWLLAHVGAGMNHDYIVIYKTSDGGQSWGKIIDPYIDGGIQGCSKTGMLFADTQNGWLTGDCNGVASGVLLYRSIDGGVTWQAVTLPEPTGEAGLYASFEVDCGSYWPTFSTSLTGMLVVRCVRYTADPMRSDYFLYSTKDGGETWISSTYPGGRPYFTSDESGLALGEKIYQTADAGQSWIQIGELTGGTQFSMLEHIGWAIVQSDGSSDLYSSTDSGQTWQLLEALVVP